MGTALAAIAIVRAAVALIVSFAIPGPTGASGADGADGATEPQGPADPAGPGTLTNSTRCSPWFTGHLPISDCTNIHALELTVASAAAIVMMSTVHVWIEHMTGTTDTWSIHTPGSPTDGSTSATDRIAYTAEIPSAWPSDPLINMAGTFVNAIPSGPQGCTRST